MTTLKVSQTLIDRGHRGSADSCPISLAAMEACPDAVRASVNQAYIRVQLNDGKSMLVGQLSPRAMTFVRNFDHGLRVSPSVFRLKLVRFDDWVPL